MWNDDVVIEAGWPRVHVVTKDFIYRDNSIVEEVDFPCKNPYTARTWAEMQVGRPYDWTALLGFLVRHKWASNDRWFCSEFAAMAFQKGGSPLFRPESLTRVTPQHLWMLPPSSDKEV